MRSLVDGKKGHLRASTFFTALGTFSVVIVIGWVNAQKVSFEY
jgi:hypothetical protein